jgi:hypothetical protein
LELFGSDIATAARPGQSAVNPILHRIVYGSSSTSMDLIREGLRGQKAPRLFRSATLYNTIVFKYPNFEGTMRPARSASANNRPVETGIYIPHDPKHPLAGGPVVYPRRSNSELLMREYLGLSALSNDRRNRDDLAILDVIDRVPSMDPFLLKTRFDTLKISVPDGCLHISDHEELATRQLIEDKLSTVITKSFERHGGVSPERMRHAIDVIWNPSRADAARFLTAFGFRLSEAPELFFALQGITFYETLFNGLRNRLEGLVAWLAGPAAAPEDIRSRPRHEAQRHAMLVSEVSSIVHRSAAEVAGVFATFDDAIRRFERSHDPSPLRAFLAMIHRHFWRIGHVLTAIINACLTVEERKQRSRGTEKVTGSVETLLFVRAVMGDSAEGYRATLAPG